MSLQFRHQRNQCCMGCIITGCITGITGCIIYRYGIIHPSGQRKPKGIKFKLTGPVLGPWHRQQHHETMHEGPYRYRTGYTGAWYNAWSQSSCHCKLAGASYPTSPAIRGELRSRRPLGSKQIFARHTYSHFVVDRWAMQRGSRVCFIESMHTRSPAPSVVASQLART